MSKLLLGDTRPNEIWLNEQNEVKQIYMDQDLIWERKPDIWTYFNNGFINDITWTANAYGEAAKALTKTSYLQLYYTGSARGSWRTSSPVRIPRTAAKLQVKFKKTNSGTLRATFGLVHESVTGGTGQVSTANGGQNYGWTSLSGTATWTMTLNSNLPNSNEYYIVCSALISGTSRADLEIYTVRFLDANDNYLN